MAVRGRGRWLAVASVVALLGTLLAGLASAAPQGARQQYIVVVKNSADYDAIRSKVQQQGAKVISDLREIRSLVVSSQSDIRASLAADGRIRGVAVDHVEQVAPFEQSAANLDRPGLLSAKAVKVKAPKANVGGAVDPDPAFDYAGLMWSIERSNVVDAWNVTTGSHDVTVGVADTGLDFTHRELRTQVKKVIDFTVTEDPNLCTLIGGFSDADLAEHVGGPETTDWHGHGSWIGGNIAGALDGRGVNGIAPGVRLVSLKISGWCGSAYDSTILAAFVRAAKLKIDVVSISFGGYLDRSDPSQDLIWNQYVDAVAFAKVQGTVIVASAGNEHAQVSAPDGLVTSHGVLTSPIGEFVDYFGQYEVPGGIPGVVDVSSTGNKVNSPAANCPPGSIGSDADPNATCKPTIDPHQSFGIGQEDQLAYYSSYGSRIDLAGPGGARKFNLPLWDRGGTPGYPVTDADVTNAWEDFSITSNWATGITCYTFTQGSGFWPASCYSSIQGTSMATPHVSGVIALVASAHPELRHDVDALIAFVKDGARSATNSTPVLSETDTSGGDLGGIYGVDCVSGYCHLGGAVISAAEAYGAGIIDASVLLG